MSTETDTRKEYLGDSVYAHFDGYHVVLTTENGLPGDPSNTIALDPPVLRALDEYVTRLRTPRGEPGDVAEELVATARERMDKHAGKVARGGRIYAHAFRWLWENVDAERLIEIGFDRDGDPRGSVTVNTIADGNRFAAEFARANELEIRHRPFDDKEPNRCWSFRPRESDVDLSFWLTVGATACRRVPTGRTREVPEYEIVCDGEEPVPDDAA